MWPIKQIAMDTPLSPTPTHAAAHYCCAEAKAVYHAFEVLLLILVAKGIIDPEAVAAGIESLASRAPDRGPPTGLSVGVALAFRANSLLAARVSASPADAAHSGFQSPLAHTAKNSGAASALASAPATGPPRHTPQP